ncbi:MAG: ABC transporter permease [Anaerolineales bacterium]|nr:ABC transporter permease [Anaerolineales bacterium]
MEKKRRVITLLSIPSIWLLLFFVLPFTIMLLFSIRETTFSPIFPPTLSHYIEFLTTPVYLRLLLSSAWIAFVTAVITILLAYPLAYYLIFHGGKHRLALLSFLILPAWTSYLLRVLAWKVILGSNGIINTFLLSLGLIDEGMPIFLYSQSAVIITLVYVWIPYAALPIFSTLERIDIKLIEASQDLGASPLRTFLRVTLPLSTPGLVSAFFFVFIPSLGEWVTPSLVGGADGIMYGNLVQTQFLRGLNWPMGTVMSTVLLLIVSVFTMLFNRHVTMKEMSALA